MPRAEKDRVRCDALLDLASMRQSVKFGLTLYFTANTIIKDIKVKFFGRRMNKAEISTIPCTTGMLHITMMSFYNYDNTVQYYDRRKTFRTKLLSPALCLVEISQSSL